MWYENFTSYPYFSRSAARLLPASGSFVCILWTWA